MAELYLTFQLSRAELEEKRAQASQQGLILVGDSGTGIKFDSVVFDFSYTEPNLEITVEHIPWPLTKSFVTKKITEQFQGANNG